VGAPVERWVLMKTLFQTLLFLTFLTAPKAPANSIFELPKKQFIGPIQDWNYFDD
jgi:hypothetical protein